EDEPTLQQQEAIQRWLFSHVGEPYVIVGDHALTALGWSCAALSNDALQEVGRGFVPYVSRALVIAPYDLLHWSRPVRDITIRVGQKLEMPVYGVVLDKGSHPC